jgi:type IV pilus assembly protein PilW
MAHRQRGLSVIELMVGAALGLFLVAGAITLFVSNMTNSRQMLLEARINQDLRATADLIARDLRRAGFWANAINVTTANNYSPISVAGSQIEYRFARDTNNTVENNEQFGFRLNNGVIQMKVNGTPTWQDLTDPNAATVTQFAITSNETIIPVGDSCVRGCNTVPPPMPAASTVACPNPPAVTVRRYDLVLEATAPTNAAVRRTLRESVRIRNDQVQGSCPT